MNRSQARADVRSRLADPSPGGLWTDAQLTAALARAHAQLAPRFLLDRVASTAVSAGATSLPIPAGAATVRELVDARGHPIPHDADRPPPTLRRPALTWRAVAGMLELSRAVGDDEAGAWSIRSTQIPADPASDSASYELPDTIAPALVALAAAACLRARLADDAKRGHPTRQIHERTARAFEAEAEAIVESHTRVARGGTFA